MRGQLVGIELEKGRTSQRRHDRQCQALLGSSHIIKTKLTLASTHRYAFGYQSRFLHNGGSEGLVDSKEMRVENWEASDRSSPLTFS